MEKSEIYSRIDTLVAMARSKSNIEDLENELVKLNKSIEAAKQELAEFTNTISNEKYFDASSEVVDRNIALGLTKKIKKLQETEKELKTAKDQKQTEVTSLKTDYDNMQQQIKDIDESIAAVKVRINGNSESENDKFNQKIASLQTARNDLNDSYSILGEQIAGLETELSKIEEQIKQIVEQIKVNQEQLAEVKSSLEKADAYLDLEQKAKDEAKVAELNGIIEQGTNRIREIQEDPVMLGKDAKELILASDITGALTKIRLLTTIVKKIPYMDLPSDENLQTILTGELARAEAARDELAASINNKTYELKQSNVETNRINYLQKRITKNEETLRVLQVKITDVDEDRIFGIDQEIANLLVEISQMNTDLQKVQKLADAEKGLARKTALTAMVESKKEQIRRANEILSQYRNEQAKDIVMAGRLQNEDVQKVLTQIEEAKTEIKNIETSLLNTSNQSRDIIAEEADKAELVAKSQVVNDIKHRQAFPNSPDNILKDIETGLGTIINPEVTNDIQIVQPVEVSKEAMAVEPNLPIVEESPEVENNQPVLEATQPVIAEGEEQVLFPQAVVAEPVTTAEPEVIPQVQPEITAVESNQPTIAETQPLTNPSAPVIEGSAQPLTELPSMIETTVAELFAKEEPEVVEITADATSEVKNQELVIPEGNAEPTELIASAEPAVVNSSDIQPTTDKNQELNHIKVTAVTDVQPIAQNQEQPAEDANVQQVEASKEEVLPAFTPTLSVAEQPTSAQPTTYEVKDPNILPEAFYKSNISNIENEEITDIDNYLNFNSGQANKTLALEKAA